jgi:CheY-like chemotaxis protein
MWSLRMLQTFCKNSSSLGLTFLKLTPLNVSSDRWGSRFVSHFPLAAKPSHRVRLSVSCCQNSRPAKVNRTRRSKAFHVRCYERMVVFTNTRPQENATVAVFLSLALLVLRPGCVAKSAKKILLVEDNDEIRELLALFMKHLGYKVFAAARGLEAIDRASVVHPDLIMMDIRMPGMHGDDATARLKANPSTRDIPVLVVTAYGAGIDTRRALAAGAQRFCINP